jgi:hypothetical protein
MGLKAAYVTLLTKPEYLPGTLVLDISLREVKAEYPLVVMTTPSLPQNVKGVLHNRGIKARTIQSLQPADGKHALSPLDSRFADTWTKLRWLQYIHCLSVLTDPNYRAFELAEYDVCFN